MSTQSDVTVGFLNLLQLEAHIAVDGVIVRRLNYREGVEELLVFKEVEEFLKFMDQSYLLARQGWSETITRRFEHERKKKEDQDRKTAPQQVPATGSSAPAPSPAVVEVTPRRRS